VYVLTQEVVAKLQRLPPGLDPAISRLDVSVQPDQNGEDILSFRVVLKGDLPETASADFGERLMRIASALRARAAQLEVPMFALVTFVHESEVRPRTSKTA